MKWAATSNGDLQISNHSSKSYFGHETLLCTPDPSPLSSPEQYQSYPGPQKRITVLAVVSQSETTVAAGDLRGRLCNRRLWNSPSAIGRVLTRSPQPNTIAVPVCLSEYIVWGNSEASDHHSRFGLIPSLTSILAAPSELGGGWRKGEEMSKHHRFLMLLAPKVDFTSFCCIFCLFYCLACPGPEHDFGRHAWKAQCSSLSFYTSFSLNQNVPFIPLMQNG